jgi:putative thioredoxin
MKHETYVKDVGLEDFERSVVEESARRPVAVDFWAAWCGPCRILGPILERLAEEFGGDFLLAKVDTEAEPELAMQFGIRSIPNVKVFRDGRVVDEMVGALPEDGVRGFLRRHCPSPADRKHAEGMAELAGGRTERARSAFEAALASDPGHAGVLVELGKLAAASGDYERAAADWARVPASSPLWDQAQTLARSLEFSRECAQGGGEAACAQRASEEPANLQARFAHGCCLAARGKHRDALEEFLFVVGRDKNFNDQAARKAMLTVFSLAGERSELAEEYRKRLALVLF